MWKVSNISKGNISGFASLCSQVVHETVLNVFYFDRRGSLLGFELKTKRYIYICILMVELWNSREGYLEEGAGILPKWAQESKNSSLNHLCSIVLLEEETVSRRIGILCASEGNRCSTVLKL